LNSVPSVTIPVGVIVERCKAESPWLDYTWRAIEVLHGEVVAAPWTPVGLKEATNRFYAGAARVQLYRTEASNYRDNLNSGATALWVVLRATGGEPPYTLVTVTADPAEGEAATEAGDDLVETVRMPSSICRILEAFVAEHGVDRPFVKRQRDRVALDPPTTRCRAGTRGKNE
jgi:Protein of unknown function (DUF3305)